MSNISERQTSHWDIRAAPRNYTTLVLTQGGGAIASFASIWFLTRFLGPTGYGGIVAIVAASWMAQVLINWSAMAVVRFGVDEFVERGVIATIFWLRLLVVSINAAIVLSLSPLWFPPLAGWLRLPPGTYPYVAWHFIAFGLWVHVQHSLQGAKLPRVQGALLMTERVLILILFALLAEAGHISVVNAIRSYIGAAAAMAIIGLYRLRHLIFHRWTVHWAFVRTVSAFSIPLLPFTIIGYLSGSYLDAAFVTRFLGTRDLGFYSVSSQISGVAIQLPALANTLLLPLFVTLQKENQAERLRRLLRDLLPSLTLLWGLGATAAAFIGSLAIPPILGHEFKASVEPLWILLAATTLTLPVLTGYSALSNAESRTYVATIAAVVAAAANLAFNSLLIPRQGMAGCAWATMIAYFASAATFATLLRGQSNVSLRSLGVSVVPAVTSAMTFTMTRNALLSFGICVVATAIIGVFHSGRLRRTVQVIRNLQARGEPDAC